jgi:hypothetical protein
VVESELAALSLVLYAADRKLPIAINYCSHVYKARVQNAGRRRRAAVLAAGPDEWITASGFIGRLVVQAPPAGEIAVHPTLLAGLASSGLTATVRYFQADLTDRPTAETVAELPLGRRRSIFVERKAASEAMRLSPDELAAAAAAWSGGAQGPAAPGQLPGRLSPWEAPGEGLQEIAPGSARPATSSFDML